MPPPFAFPYPRYTKGNTVFQGILGSWQRYTRKGYAPSVRRQSCQRLGCPRCRATARLPRLPCQPPNLLLKNSSGPASADFSLWQAYCLLYTEGRMAIFWPGPGKIIRKFKKKGLTFFPGPATIIQQNKEGRRIRLTSSAQQRGSHSNQTASGGLLTATPAIRRRGAPVRVITRMPKRRPRFVIF